MKVRIYKDPITKLNLEGVATIIEILDVNPFGDNDGEMTSEVDFGDDIHVNRTHYSDDVLDENSMKEN